jgi:hypothetical protein
MALQPVSTKDHFTLVELNTREQESTDRGTLLDAVWRLGDRLLTYFGLRTSDLGRRTSDFGLRTSDFGLRTSDFGPRTSDVGLRTSDFGPRTSDLPIYPRYGIVSGPWGRAATRASGPRRSSCSRTAAPISWHGIKWAARMVSSGSAL